MINLDYLQMVLQDVSVDELSCFVRKITKNVYSYQM